MSCSNNKKCNGKLIALLIGAVVLVVAIALLIGLGGADNANQDPTNTISTDSDVIDFGDLIGDLDAFATNE